MKVLFSTTLAPISEIIWPHLKFIWYSPLVLMTVKLQVRLVQRDGGMDCPAIAIRPPAMRGTANRKSHDTAILGEKEKTNYISPLK
jgi:hypothetical protein